MTDKLSAEQRKKVAEASGVPPAVLKRPSGWRPDLSTAHWKLLITKTAQLIEVMDRDNLGTMMRFNEHLATGATDDIERLCHELLEAQ